MELTRGEPPSNEVLKLFVAEFPDNSSCEYRNQEAI